MDSVSSGCISIFTGNDLTIHDFLNVGKKCQIFKVRVIKYIPNHLKFKLKNENHARGRFVRRHNKNKERSSHWLNYTPIRVRH